MSPPPDLEHQINKILDELYAGMVATLQEHGAVSYFYGDLTGQSQMNIGLHPRIATQPAIDFADDYLNDLRMGGSKLNGEFVPWLEKYGKEANADPLYKTIMKGIREGKPLGRWEFREAEGYPTNTVASDIQDFMQQQYRSGASRIARTETVNILNNAAIDRYEKTGIEQVRVRDGCGCDVCAGINGEIWDLDYARSHILEHPNCKRSFEPIVKDYAIPGPGKPSPMPEDDPGSSQYTGG